MLFITHTVPLPLVTLYILKFLATIKDSVKIKHQLRSIKSNYLHFIEAAIERCLKSFLNKVVEVFLNEVFLLWSKSCRKTFISIADLINYSKYS